MDGLSISVIINTTDRAEQLALLLRSLDQQSYADFEIIVVVGPTEDNTLQMLVPYEERVRIFHCPAANLSRSRNIGLLAAHGDVVAFIDDDAVPSQRWLEQLAGLFEDGELDATGGTVFFAHPGDWKTAVQFRRGITSALLEQKDDCEFLPHIVSQPGKSTHWVPRFMGANMAFRRDAILEIGGFDEFYKFIAEESDVAVRLSHAAKVVRPVREATVYHFPASSRNRIAFTQKRRHWMETRSGVYYVLRNGPSAGDPWPVIIERCVEFLHGHIVWLAQLRREGQLAWSQLFVGGLREILAVVQGVVGALIGRRKSISARAITEAAKSDTPILRYQVKDGSMEPSIDPVTGAQPELLTGVAPLRICLLSYTYPPKKFDGVGRLTNLMARGLSELGHHVHVITHGDREKVSYYDGAYVHEIPYPLERYQSYRRFDRTYHALNNSHAVFERVKSLMLNEGIQILDSPLWLYAGLVTEVSGLLPVVVRLVTASRQVSALHKEHNPDAHLMGEMERMLIEHADHLFPNTKATLNALTTIYDFTPDEDRYTVVPYGIVPAPDADARPFDLNDRDRPKVVLFVGRLEKRKGVVDLFDAVPRVLKRFPDVRFVFAGADNSRFDGFGSQHGIDYPGYFSEKYPRHMSSVEFTGEVSDERLQQLYQDCDLFVAPSLYESFGLVYLEAMNYAKPVIGCSAGGVPEVIADGVTGRLVPPSSPDALAGAIISLLGSPEQLRPLVCRHGARSSATSPIFWWDDGSLMRTERR
jgi:glycosyltransferase involved in cell wall biosynthesis